MGNALIVIILLFVVVAALLRFRNHFRGGGCCGSGSNTIRLRKTLSEPAIGKMVLTVQGMHCENCQARIENAINRLEGVACLVDLRKKTATITYSHPISAQELTQILQRLGYQVTDVCSIDL